MQTTGGVDGVGFFENKCSSKEANSVFVLKYSISLEMWILESWKENLMKMQVERNKSRKRKNKKIKHNKKL